MAGFGLNEGWLSLNPGVLPSYSCGFFSSANDLAVRFSSVFEFAVWIFRLLLKESSSEFQVISLAIWSQSASLVYEGGPSSCANKLCSHLLFSCICFLFHFGWCSFICHRFHHFFGPPFFYISLGITPRALLYVMMQDFYHWLIPFFV